jgi:hypothetical protein
LQRAGTIEAAVELQTPAPASTLVFSHSLLSFTPIANRGQVLKVHFINSGLGEHAADHQSAFCFHRDKTSFQAAMSGAAPVGVAL